MKVFNVREVIRARVSSERAFRIYDILVGCSLSHASNTQYLEALQRQYGSVASVYAKHYVFTVTYALAQDNILDGRLFTKNILRRFFHDAEISLREMSFSEKQIKKHIRLLWRSFCTVKQAKDLFHVNKYEETVAILKGNFAYGIPFDTISYDLFCSFLCSLYKNTVFLFSREENMQVYLRKAPYLCLELDVLNRGVVS